MSERAPLADDLFPSRRRLVLLASLVFVLLFSRSMNRDFDLDEHQFVAPAVVLLEEGQVPYTDYPYFHMPTLVGIYAGLIGWVPYKLLAARLVSTVCGTATVMMLFTLCWRMLTPLPSAMRWRLAGGLTLIYFCSRLFTYTTGWAWNHDTSVCCALAALIVHRRGLQGGSSWCGLAAGFLLGTAIGIRLSFVLAIIPFAASALFFRSTLSTRQRMATVALGVAGATLALLPAIVLMLDAPAQFFFGNLGYVGLNTIFYVESEPASVRPLEGWFRLFRTFASDPGNTALAGFFLYAIGYRFWRVRAWRDPRANDVLLPLAMLPFLLIGVMGPTPVQYQYPYMLLPFVTLAIVGMIAIESTDSVMLDRWLRWVKIFAIIAATTGLPRWYWPVIYLPTPARWTPVRVHRAGEWVKANTPAGARVLTIDPIVPLETDLRIYPEFSVGRFVNHVGKFMTPEDRGRFRMAWSEELDRVVAERPPDAILIDSRVLYLAPAFVHYAERHGFRRLESPTGEYILWTRQPEPRSLAERR